MHRNLTSNDVWREEKRRALAWAASKASKRGEIAESHALAGQLIYLS
jgi:hypothetical protein